MNERPESAAERRAAKKGSFTASWPRKLPVGSRPFADVHRFCESVKMTAFAFIGAALAEIAGCFAFWAWLRLGKSALWIAPGILSLCLFAYLLTLPQSDQAGRSYAAYGGVYIASAVAWLWFAEDTKPDRWDLLGAAICLVGAAVIYFGPRTANGS